MDIAETEATERDLLVLEIMALAYAVDRLTPYAVFIDYYGHTGYVSVKIVESADRYQNEIASTAFYQKHLGGLGPDNDPLAWLKAKQDHLRHILQTHDVEFDAMEQVIERTVTYAF